MNMLANLMESTSAQTAPSTLMPSTPVLGLGEKKNLEDAGTSIPVKTAEPTMKSTPVTKMDAVLCDMDGTLSNPYHRRHFVRIKPKNWVAFFKGMVDDTPIEPICTIIRELYKEGKYKVIIFSARPDNYKKETEEWLAKHNIKYDAIYMREAKDNRSDEFVKQEMLDKVKEDGYNPVAWFDDRPCIVRLARRNNIMTFACHNSDEEF